jgi:hypothetical protein
MKNAKGVDVRPGMLATVVWRDHMGNPQRITGAKVLFTRFRPRIGYMATTLLHTAPSPTGKPCTGRIVHDVDDIVSTSREA